MAFQRYERKGGKYYDPMISIGTAGQIIINRAAIEKYHGLSRTKFVDLYFDKDKGIIGIKHVDKKDNGTFKFTSNKIGSNSSIAGKSFLKHHGIDFKAVKRYVPSWNGKEEMLTIEV